MDAIRRRSDVSGSEQKYEGASEKRSENRSATGTGVSDVSHRSSIASVHIFHELRNVLASILCLGDQIILDKESAGPLVDELKGVCTYALDTINDMVDVARITDGSAKLDEAPFLVQQLLSETKRIQGARKKNGVDLKIERGLIDIRVTIAAGGEGGGEHQRKPAQRARNQRRVCAHE